MLMPALFPGPVDLLTPAPVLVASGFNIVGPFQSLTGRDISEGDVDAAFAYQVGSNFVDGFVVLQASGGDGSVAIFRLNPSRGERNVMGQFELASALGVGPVPGPSSVVLLAAAGLFLAAWRMAGWQTQ
jgi:hypothetical protein